MFDIRRLLEPIHKNFIASNGFTFASLMLSFNGEPHEFPKFISRILEEEGFISEAQAKGSQQTKKYDDFIEYLTDFKKTLDSRKQHKKTSVAYREHTTKLTFLYGKITDEYGKFIYALTKAKNSCLLSDTKNCVNIQDIFQNLKDISKSEDTSNIKSALEAAQIHEEFLKLPRLISDWKLDIKEEQLTSRLKMEMVKLQIKNKQDEIVIDLRNYPMIDRCIIDCSSVIPFSSRFSSSNLPGPKDYKLYTDKLKQLFLDYGLDPSKSNLEVLNLKIEMKLKLQSIESKYPNRNLTEIKTILQDMGVIIMSKDADPLEVWTAYDNIMQQLEKQYDEISQEFPPNARPIKVKISTLLPTQIRGFIEQLERRRSDFKLKCN